MSSSSAEPKKNIGEYFADIATALVFVEAQWEIFEPRSEEYREWAKVSLCLHKLLLEARDALTDDNEKKVQLKRGDLHEKSGETSVPTELMAPRHIELTHEQALLLLDALSRIAMYIGKKRNELEPFSEEWSKQEHEHRQIHKVRDFLVLSHKRDMDLEKKSGVKDFETKSIPNDRSTSKPTFAFEPEGLDARVSRERAKEKEEAQREEARREAARHEGMRRHASTMKRDWSSAPPPEEKETRPFHTHPVGETRAGHTPPQHTPAPRARENGQPREGNSGNGPLFLKATVGPAWAN